MKSNPRIAAIDKISTVGMQFALDGSDLYCRGKAEARPCWIAVVGWRCSGMDPRVKPEDDDCRDVFRQSATLVTGRNLSSSSSSGLTRGAIPEQSNRKSLRSFDILHMLGPSAPQNEKGALRPLVHLECESDQAASAAVAASSASVRARSLAPLASTSRSTNSTTARGALSPARKPAFMMRR